MPVNPKTLTVLSGNHPGEIFRSGAPARCEFLDRRALGVLEQIPDPHVRDDFIRKNGGLRTILEADWAVTDKRLAYVSYNVGVVQSREWPDIVGVAVLKHHLTTTTVRVSVANATAWDVNTSKPAARELVELVEAMIGQGGPG